MHTFNKKMQFLAQNLLESWINVKKIGPKSLAHYEIKSMLMVQFTSFYFLLVSHGQSHQLLAIIRGLSIVHYLLREASQLKGTSRKRISSNAKQDKFFFLLMAM